MDKGSPDNPRGSLDNPSRLEAASKWTRVRRTTPGVRRTTLHDLRRPPNGQGFAGQPQGFAGQPFSMDKGSPDNPRGSPDNPSRLEAASKWTRVRRTTCRGSPDNPSRLEAASKWTRVRRTTPGVRRTTLHDLRRPPNGQGFAGQPQGFAGQPFTT